MGVPLRGQAIRWARIQGHSGHAQHRPRRPVCAVSFTAASPRRAGVPKRCVRNAHPAFVSLALLPSQLTRRSDFPPAAAAACAKPPCLLPLGRGASRSQTGAWRRRGTGRGGLRSRTPQRRRRPRRSWPANRRCDARPDWALSKQCVRRVFSVEVKARAREGVLTSRKTKRGLHSPPTSDLALSIFHFPSLTAAPSAA